MICWVKAGSTPENYLSSVVFLNEHPWCDYEGPYCSEGTGNPLDGACDWSGYNSNWYRENTKLNSNCSVAHRLQEEHIVSLIKSDSALAKLFSQFGFAKTTTAQQIVREAITMRLKQLNATEVSADKLINIYQSYLNDQQDQFEADKKNQADLLHAKEVKESAELLLKAIN